MRRPECPEAEGEKGQWRGGRRKGRPVRGVAEAVGHFWVCVFW